MSEARPSPGLSVLVLSGSSRRDSLNGQLAALAARIATEAGATVDLATPHEFDVPGYDGDDEAAAGIPDPVLRQRFQRNIQAFLSLAEAAKHYGCMKRSWVEFLGEPPGAGEDRVDPPAP